jgi:hypothetical protein
VLRETLIRQGLLQALELGFGWGEGLREALALGGVLGRGEQRRDLPGEAREDRTDHPQVVVPGPFGTGGQALIGGFLLAAVHRLEKQSRVLHQALAAGCLLVVAVQALELPGRERLLLELLDEGAGVLGVGARQRHQDAAGRPE